jgi:hypothetical protein
MGKNVFPKDLVAKMSKQRSYAPHPNGQKNPFAMSKEKATGAVAFSF